ETANAAAVDLPVLEFPINENIVPKYSTSCFVFKNAVTNEETLNITASSSNKFPFTSSRYICHQPSNVPLGCKSYFVSQMISSALDSSMSFERYGSSNEMTVPSSVLKTPTPVYNVEMGSD